MFVMWHSTAIIAYTIYAFNNQYMHIVHRTIADGLNQKEQKMQTIFIYIIECLALLLLQGINICRYVLYHSIVILCRLTACVCIRTRLYWLC